MYQFSLEINKYIYKPGGLWRKKDYGKQNPIIQYS